jgi:hypothetical protein
MFLISALNNGFRWSSQLEDFQSTELSFKMKLARKIWDQGIDIA